MKIAFCGCGYVFDIYMRTRWAHGDLEIQGVFDIDRARAEVVARHYGLKIYESYEALLADPNVELVVNLTSIHAHFAVTKQALEAGKHVYSEKPLATDFDEAKALFDLAEERGLVFTGAPCNLFSDSVQTMWKAVRDGAVGTPLLVYAELDDNPIYQMNVETWRSATGAPWPYIEEYQEGCTYEHVGYHLVWICAMLGPAKSVTAFSKATVQGKTSEPLDPADTPDFSVGLLDFEGDAAARITCSIVAPTDHRLRLIGREGEISVESYRMYQSPVMLERFSTVSLNARKAYTARTQPLIGRPFGVGGQALKLLRHFRSHAVEADGPGRRSLKQKLMSVVRRREVYCQDKLLGVAVMARAIRENQPQPMPADFMLHINELTLLIQNAGPNGIAQPVRTTFKPLAPLPEIANAPGTWRDRYRPRFLERMLGRTVDAMHSH
jgi:predicted dehydrogenase